MDNQPLKDKAIYNQKLKIGKKKSPGYLVTNNACMLTGLDEIA